MPQKWAANWPMPDNLRGEGERESLIHTLGNLTLLTSRLNSKASNGPWTGVGGKRATLEMHDVLFVNRELLKSSELEWSETMIRSRSEELAKLITKIWPTPEGYKSGFATETVRPRHRVDLSDLIAAELLTAGATLKPRPKKHREQEAVVLSDGCIEWNGQFFSSPSLAGRAIAGQTAVNGWYFFSIEADKKRKVLNALRIEYLDAIAADPEDDDAEE